MAEHDVGRQLRPVLNELQQEALRENLTPQFIAYLEALYGSKQAVFVAPFGHADADMYATPAFRGVAFSI